MMHHLLIRQLRRQLGNEFTLDDKWSGVLEAISRHYLEAEQERRLLENALEVNSAELTEANAHLRAQSEQEHALLRGVIDSIPDLIFFKTPDGIYLGCNKALEAFLGKPEHEIVGKSDADLLEPATARACVEKDRQMQLLNQPSIDEEWMEHPKLGSRCLEILRTPYFSVDGKPLGMIGIGRDITERKRLDERMRIAAMVYQNSGEGILVTDAANRIVSINPAFTRITGYYLEEILGRDPSMLSSGYQDRAFYAAMWHALETDGHWSGELWNRRKNGDVLAKRMIINKLQNGSGDLQGYVALFSDITEHKKSEELIWRQANFDELTGLPNRRMFGDRLSQELRNEQRSGGMLAVLFIDLDHFKEINDTLGHDVGDALLAEAGRRIRACTRESDTVSRLGGDEFTVSLPQIGDASHVERIAQAVNGRLAEPFVLAEKTIRISASIGISVFPTDAADSADLLRHADQAMYVAKSQGGNRFSYFTCSLQEAAQKRLQLISDMQTALETGQFAVLFQPIVELASGRIRKAEALAHWHHPERGVLEPAAFLPLAEETGLITEIGNRVFQQTAAWASGWNGNADGALQLCLNISQAQLKKDGVLETWGAQMNRLGLHAADIALEIDEALLRHDAGKVADHLQCFREAGFQFAIDGFGTGYSSLSCLNKRKIAYLKIDQAVVCKVGTDAGEAALAGAIIVMAHKLGLDVVAEGVETEVQRDFLLQAGCDYAQGPLFARPLAPEEFEALLRSGCVPARPGTGLELCIQ